MAPNMRDLVHRIHDGTRRSVSVAVCCKVESFDPTGPEVALRPLVREVRLQDGEWIDVPSVVVHGVPVAYPGGGVRGMTWGYEVGDEVIAVVRHQSHDKVDADRPRDNDGTVSPTIKRRLDLSDAIVVAGYESPGRDRPTARFRQDGQVVVYFAASESAHFGDSTANKALALAEAVDDRLSTLQQKHDALVASFNSHTQPVSTTPTGGLVAGPPTPTSTATVGALATTACTDVKVRS